jgi:septum formation protein
MNPLLSDAVQRNLVLASRSPRRIDILTGLEFEFEVLPAHDHVEDSAVCDDVFERAVVRARIKAEDVARRRPRATVVGADTVVIIDGEVLEKPADDDEAFRFLKKLSGREHVVVTGVAIRRQADGLDLAAKEKTRVLFRELGDTDIRLYVASGEGRDKAGSYAVQGLGAGLVRSIEGCFYNVVGFPVSLFFDLLRKVPPLP